jgi:hypothetical protein
VHLGVILPQGPPLRDLEEEKTDTKKVVAETEFTLYRLEVCWITVNGESGITGGCDRDALSNGTGVGEAEDVGRGD